MQINFLGDSITEGVGASALENRYSTLVCKRFGATENNFGVSASRIARQSTGVVERHDEYFILRAKRMPNDADFTVVFGGTNDFGHGDAPLGVKGDLTENTFYGAVEQLVTYLVANFPRQKLLFILPLPRNNQNNLRGDGAKQPTATLNEYVAIEREVLQRHGIDFLDLSADFPYEETLQTRLFTDGLHPSDKGHALLAERIIQYISNRI